MNEVMYCMNGFALPANTEIFLHCGQTSSGTHSSYCLVETRDNVVQDTRLLIHFYVVPRIICRAKPLCPHVFTALCWIKQRDSAGYHLPKVLAQTPCPVSQHHIQEDLIFSKTAVRISNPTISCTI